MKLFKKQRHNQDSFKRLIHRLSGMSEADLNKVNQFELIKQDQNFILEGGAGSGKTYSLISIIEKISIEEPKQSIKIVYRERSALFFILSFSSCDTFSKSSLLS
ncbi:hypothetical protein [Streptococcus ovuberis]|uniref:Uncharacterized protein n=1 Tax=Streptococcus ovuberis TaxID=1936207 RepID=A0A7X6N3G3_9STRE|nr:hypothetical protein [Streptococcus ovuberis]NKZ21442.1 hypothetical protein [Streptococcus ovuberis]